jgi:tetrahydromethanopterin S-methyltransferase subunit E
LNASFSMHAPKYMQVHNVYNKKISHETVTNEQNREIKLFYMLR